MDTTTSTISPQTDTVTRGGLSAERTSLLGRALHALTEYDRLQARGDAGLAAEPLATVLAEVCASLHTVSADRDLQEQRRREAQQAAQEARDGLRRYREQVRDAIVEAQSDHGLCVDGTNEVLEGLGLDPIAREWEVSIVLTATQEITVTVEAKTAEDAQRMVDDGDVDLDAEVSDRDWDWSADDAVEVTDVQAV